LKKNTRGQLAIIVVGVAAFWRLLAFFETPTACPCNSS